MANAKLYVGASLDAPGGAPKGPWHYDPDDLTTHGLIVGMTGSGKTGLALVLLEELLLQRIPLVILDPKGDLANLCLQFPGFEATAFAPWVSAAEARRRGCEPVQLAAETAASWRDGLAKWTVAPARLNQLRELAAFRVFTPGSSAGEPLNVLSMLQPDRGDLADPERRADRVSGAASALLGLVGIEADPIQSPEHILLANILEFFWSQGHEVTMESLLGAIQSPPVTKLGIFPVDELYPPAQRRKLAMTLNGIVAAPSFALWRQGSPLAMDALLAERGGRVPCNIFYLAHLSDAERMFVVAAVLNEMVAWMRRQQGSDALRALLYFDEIAGYAPPYPRNPAAKGPLMTLLKQARAFGVGVLLATQNPVDVDYKGLTNMGTWFIGRLQAEGDKARLLDGLELAGGGPNRADTDAAMSALQKRQFLVKNVHEEELAFITTRWAMSYLAGPMSLANVAALYTTGVLQKPSAAGPVPALAAAAAPPAADATPAVAGPPAPAPSAPAGLGGDLPAEPQVFPSWPRVYLAPGSAHYEELKSLFPKVAVPQALPFRYAPYVLARVKAVFDEERHHFFAEQEFYRAAGPLDAAATPVWENLSAVWAGAPLSVPPAAGARFAPVAATWLDRKAEAALTDTVLEDVWREEAIELQRHAALKLVSQPGESRDAFVARCRAAADDEVDAKVRTLETRYKQKLNTLGDRLQRARIELAHKEQAHAARRNEELVNAGESILGMFLGSRSRRAFSGAMSKRRMTAASAQSVETKSQLVKDLEADVAAMEKELAEQIARLEQEANRRVEEIETLPVRLEKTDIQVLGFTLLWIPVRS